MDVSQLTIEQLNSNLDEITNSISFRKSRFIVNQGINSNSAFGGICAGGLDFATEEERSMIYRLKQELAARAPQERQLARQRNVARIQARNLRISAANGRH
jgi:hypothetical protein